MPNDGESYSFLSQNQSHQQGKNPWYDWFFFIDYVKSLDTTRYKHGGILLHKNTISMMECLNVS